MEAIIRKKVIRTIKTIVIILILFVSHFILDLVSLSPWSILTMSIKTKLLLSSKYPHEDFKIKSVKTTFDNWRPNKFVTVDYIENKKKCFSFYVFYDQGNIEENFIVCYITRQLILPTKKSVEKNMPKLKLLNINIEAVKNFLTDKNPLERINKDNYRQFGLKYLIQERVPINYSIKWRGSKISNSQFKNLGSLIHNDLKKQGVVISSLRFYNIYDDYKDYIEYDIYNNPDGKYESFNEGHL